MTPNDYWKESIAEAADSCGLTLTPLQLQAMADSVQIDHENYGLAFYSPPSSDRKAAIDSEWKRKYDALNEELSRYRKNAETAVKLALRVDPSEVVAIGERGEVELFGGQIERIQ